MESGFYSQLQKLFLSGDDGVGRSSDHKIARAIGILVGGATIIFLVLGTCYLWKKKKLQCLLKGKSEKRGNVQVINVLHT